MTDKFSPEQRSRIMAKVKGTNTGPEMIVRRMLHGMGYRYRLHCKSLPGTPDIVLSRHRKIIFVHGCFWHGHEGCSRAKRPASHEPYWSKKLDRNIARDNAARQELQEQGWKILVIWECQIHNRDALRDMLDGFMHGDL